MRFPRPRVKAVRDETIIMTGGLNEVITTLELKKGELIQCLNYQETDGPYHGYASIAGYERYDGKTLAGDIGAIQLPDEGNDSDTVLLIEAGSVSDISSSDHTIDNFGVATNSTVIKFPSESFEITNSYMRVNSQDAGQFDEGFNEGFNQEVTGVNSFLNLGTDWTLDLQIRPKVSSNLEIIFEKVGCYKLERDGLTGLLTFYTSSDGLTYDSSIAMVDGTITTALFSHISIVCRDLVLKMAINGVPIEDGLGAVIEETIPAIFQNTTDLYIGSGIVGASPYFGYLDEFRISTNYRWIRDFTPPEERYSTGGYDVLNWDDIDREAQRSLIEEVPGIGKVTGVHIYQGEVYATRNIDGISAGLYKANATGDDSTAGWVLIDNTLTLDGTLDAVNWRFSGSFSDQEVMCMVDGVSLPRIWDGTTMYLFDNTEAAGIPDRQTIPRFAKLVRVFDNKLLLAYEQDDIILSSRTDPRDYTFGYGEQLLIGDDITNLRELPGEGMGIICRNSIKILERLDIPTSSASTPDYTYKVNNFSRQAGGLPNSCERVLGNILYADDRGIISMQATDKYGDFDASAISKKVNRIYLSKKSTLSTSVVDKTLNQYRIYFSDGTGLLFTFQDEELKGATYVQYDHAVLRAVEGEDPSGDYVKYFSSEDGYVYKMDSGTSFDGGDIMTELFTSYYHYRSPRSWKQFMRAIFEITAARGTQFQIRPVYNYNADAFPETLWWDTTLKGLGGEWGRDIWSQFVWGGSVVQTLVQYLRGYGTNMSLEIMTNSKYNSQHIIHNAIVDYQLDNKQQ